MVPRGYIFDFILGYKDLQDLNLDTYLLNKLKAKWMDDTESYNVEDFVLKISIVHRIPEETWIDLPQLLHRVKMLEDMLRLYTSKFPEFKDPRWSFSSKKERGIFSENELIFDELDTTRRDGLMIFRPKIYPRRMLKNWVDAWTRPSSLCIPPWGGVLYYLIPPKYSIIKYIKYRVSIRDNFWDASIYRSENWDRDYVIMSWPCGDPDFMELKARIEVMDSKEKYKKKTSGRCGRYYRGVWNNDNLDLAFKLIEHLVEIILNVV